MVDLVSTERRRKGSIGPTVLYCLRLYGGSGEHGEGKDLGPTKLYCLRLYGVSGEHGEGKDRLISWLGKQSPVLYNTNSGKHHFTFFYKIYFDRKTRIFPLFVTKL